MSRFLVEPHARLRRQRAGRADPLIALINVVFLLLIFLMVAGTIAPALSGDVDLVETSDPTFRSPPNAAVIREDGTLVYSGNAISAQDYATLKLANGDAEIRIVPDRELPAHQLVEIVSTLRSNGSTAVWIVTERNLR